MLDAVPVFMDAPRVESAEPLAEPLTPTLSPSP
jgi:hypothetical protein